MPNRPRPGIMPRMKRFVALCLVLFYGALAGALAQGLDDEYVQVFKLIQEADSLSNSAPSQALAKYLDARTALDRLHKGSPEWNARMVNYRLGYLAERIAALSTGSSASAGQTKASAAPVSGAVPPQSTSSVEWQAQVNALQQRVGQLQSERDLLQAKLKEALAMRPAAVDPGELAKAQDAIKALEKENELLKLSAAKEKQAPALDPQTLQAVQRQLAEVNRKASDQTEALSKLALERDALQARLRAAGGSDDTLASLRTENQLLKKQLADALASSHAPAENPPQPNHLQAQVAKLQADKEALRLENIALEDRLKQLSSAAPGAIATTAQPPADQQSRINELERDRDRLQRELEAANRQKGRRKSKGTGAQVQELENQLASARTRLEVFDARAVPYSAEELALLKQPEASLTRAEPNASKHSIKELPAGAAALVAEAQKSFAAKQFDKAEAAYLQVIQQAPKNVPTLANLAAIQVEDGHLDQADSNIKRALALDPEDAYSLYVLGLLRLRQAKYDEAIDALGRSAKLDPQNAEVENYLGLALSEKGMRVPAEAALRRAVQLQPGYGGAHYNLAVVYATEHPPATELARWHYQKAIAAGIPRNPDLEKKFETP